MSRKNAAKKTSKMLAYRNPSKRVPICFEDTLKLCAYYKTNFKIGRNLNGFNDLLWGGFGIHEYEEPLHIVWIYAKKSRQALGDKYFNKIISIIENHESNNKYLELYNDHAF